MPILSRAKRVLKGAPEPRRRRAPEPETTLTVVRNSAVYAPRIPPKGSVEIPNTGLGKVLVNSLSSYDVSTDKERDEKEYTHASSLLYDICPRAISLQKRYEVKSSTTPTKGVRIIWAMGRALEDHARKGMIATQPNSIYGDWVCKCETLKMYGTTYIEASQHECGVCKGKAVNYRECVLSDKEREVKGSPDFFMLDHLGRLGIVECKSCNAKGFEARKKANAPEANHACQGLYYKRLAVRLELPVIEKVTVLYILKDYKYGKVPYLPFEVQEKDKGYMVTLNCMDSLAERVRDARACNRVPTKLVACSSPTTARAKACEFCALCFGLQE